jgi:hypothetical protein
MRGRKRRPAGNEVDELGETEHVGDCNSRDSTSDLLSMQVPFSFVRGARFRCRKSRGKPSSVRWRGHQHLWGPHGHALCHPRADSRMRTPQANGTLQRARSSCVRWLARHRKSSAVSAMVSRLARIGFEVAYWLDRGTRPTSGGMHLALPPPRRPVQIAHVEQKRRARPDSPALCDGLALPAGQLVAGSGLCLSAQLHFQVRSKTWITLCNSRSDVPSRATGNVIV